MGLERQCAYSGEARGSGARPGHRAFSYEDGEMELREKPAEEGLYPSLSLLPPPIRDQELERRGGVAGEGIWWRHLRTSAGEEGRREGGGAGTGWRNNRSPRPLVTDPISGLAPALGKPQSRASLLRVPERTVAFEVPPGVPDRLCAPESRLQRQW